MQHITIRNERGVSPMIQSVCVLIDNAPQVVISQYNDGTILSTTLGDMVTVDVNAKTFAQAVAQVVEDCLYCIVQF